MVLQSVGVVVITMGSQGTTHAVESLWNQTVRPSEVVVVDSGREEQSYDAKVIRAVGAPQGVARNMGAKNCDADVVAFLDSDCIAPPGWIARIQEDCASGMKAVGGPYLPAQDTEFARNAHRYLAKVVGWRTATFADRRGGLRKMLSVSGGDSAFDKGLFMSVNGYDERQHWREEPELCRKIRAKGIPIMFDPELWVLHDFRGWNSLRALATVAYQYGKWTTMSKREIHEP